jgi:6-pyruvoyltetrahydropterin/6-carboxytetrahydropterin synthase
MKTVYLTRRERFNAAHKMWNPEWSDEKNMEIYGKCANPNWHGHNYELFVTVKGPINPSTGYLVDLKKVSAIINKLIIEELDHKNLNLDVSFLKGKLCSTENLCVAIWEELENELNLLECKLHSIKLHETENNYVEYFGVQ